MADKEKEPTPSKRDTVLPKKLAEGGAPESKLDDLSKSRSRYKGEVTKRLSAFEDAEKEGDVLKLHEASLKLQRSHNDFYSAHNKFMEAAKELLSPQDYKSKEESFYEVQLKVNATTDRLNKMKGSTLTSLSQLKSAAYMTVTRIYKEFQNFCVSANIGLCKGKHEELLKAYQSFEATHKKYHDHAIILDPKGASNAEKVLSDINVIIATSNQTLQDLQKRQDDKSDIAQYGSESTTGSHKSEIAPHDSISNLESVRSKQSGHSKASSSQSRRQAAAAEKAALEAKLQVMEQRSRLKLKAEQERMQAKLKAEQERMQAKLKAEQERMQAEVKAAQEKMEEQLKQAKVEEELTLLELQADVAAADAKQKALSVAGSVTSKRSKTPTQTGDGEPSSGEKVKSQTTGTKPSGILRATATPFDFAGSIFRPTTSQPTFQRGLDVNPTKLFTSTEDEAEILPVRRLLDTKTKSEVKVDDTKPATKWCIRCNRNIDMVDICCKYCGARQDESPSASKTHESDKFERLIDTLNIPKGSIKTFDGDPKQYHKFINSFSSNVANKAVDDETKLSRLMDYCSGVAERTIENCSTLSPSEGYKEALRLLKKNFGKPMVIAKAWMKALTNRPELKPGDGKACKELAMDCRGCFNVLKSEGKLMMIEYNGELLGKICNLLPRYIRSKWRTIHSSIEATTDNPPSFEKFVEFIEKIADEENHHEVGEAALGELSRQSSDKKRQTQTTKKKVRGATFNVQGISTTDTSEKSYDQTRPLKCWKCSEEHKLYSCPQFKSLSPDKRLEFVKAKRLCYNCIQYSNHGVAKCRSPALCFKPECKKKHSGLLHDALEKANPKKEYSSANKPEKSDHKKETSSHDPKKDTGVVVTCEGSTNGARLPIVPIMVMGKHGWTETHALLDPASNKTICSQTLINRLGLNGEMRQLELRGVLNIAAQNTAVKLQLQVRPVDSDERIILQEVYAIKNFPDLKAHAPDISKWGYLQDLPFSDGEGAELLIGNDVSKALKPLEVREGMEDDPVAVRTIFGWIIHGRCGSSQQATCCFIQANTENVQLEKQVEQFWKLDGVPNALQYSQNEKAVIDLWDESTSMIEGHYQLPIPFKKAEPRLCNNKAVAVKRLQCLERKFKRIPGLKEKYTSEIQDLLVKGYAEPVNSPGREGTVWYIPHHNVVNPRKPDKFRIVFDCSAEYQGTSLNKEVLQGPDLTNKLIGVLLRFREGPVAIMGDIKGMFLQVKVTPEHRDALRFLYWKDGEPGTPMTEYRMTVHLFGGIWSPSAASYALRRIPQDFKDKGIPPDVTEAILKSFYVDDCLKSCWSAQEAQSFIEEISKALNFGGFHITKWISNSSKVLQSIPEKDRAVAVKSLDFESLPTERALGVVWNTDSDTLGVQVKPKDEAFTRRGVLKVLSTVYDPLGMVSPFVLKAKLIFQSECRLDKDWDDPLSDQNLKLWHRWLEDMPALQKLKVPRCVMPKPSPGDYYMEIHHFCDASEVAYGSVAYLRVVSEPNVVHCSFLMSKSRLAPTRFISIPRLELCAAVIAVKMNDILTKELQLEIRSTFYWTDSLIVLQYIKNKSRRFQTFVANRVAIIHEGSTQNEWNHVDTKLNPADHASRGLNAQDLLNNQLWSRGPEFLWKSGHQWPTQHFNIPDLLEDDVEVKKQAQSCHAKSEEKTDAVDRLINYYSCWYRLRKAVCWLRRFILWLKDRKQKQSDKLSVSELASAEKTLVKYVQSQCYADEIRSLKNHNEVSKRSSIYNLEPVLDEMGVLRVNGRLKNAAIPNDAKQQMILPGTHRVAALIVKDTHDFHAKHAGREYTMSRLREKYWIVNVRRLVRKTLSSCHMCKRIRGSMLKQRMANLPMDRVTPYTPPFTFTGVDCFGPFFVKRGRSQEKRYGCIFTCLNVRAIHLESLASMDASSFINALIRFAARRTWPQKLRSDNGTNFVGARKELKAEMAKWNDDSRFQNAVLRRGVEWQFNPPAASHMGGVWERMIRTVRSSLDVLLKGQVLDDERLSTIFCEVEIIVNRRPLTVVPNDASDFKVLTPQDILQPYTKTLQLPPTFVKEDQYGRRWRHVQYVVNLFWKRWTKEYLPTLQIRSKWLKPKENLQVGDIVLMLDETLPRNQWPLARVTEIHTSDDGLVRSVKIKTSSGVYDRPIHKLCLLEKAAEDMDP